ncbi:ROK family protein [Nanoarchaeota archaeon]
MKYAVGVDLGGTKIEAALVDEEGNAGERFRIPTDVDQGWEKMLENLVAAVEAVKGDATAIGIGTPGFFFDNKMSSIPNVPGMDKVLPAFLEKYPDAVIMNDANCFAIAEHRWGAGKGIKNMIGLIWGTGIGSGVIINNQLLLGAIGGCGEVGNMIMDKSIGEFKSGGLGTWEQLCSGPNIVRRYNEAGGRELENPSDILNAARNGDDTAAHVIHQTAQWMGMGLGSLVNIFNPDLIVIGGGVSNLDLYDELNRQMKHFSLQASGEACKVVKNQLGDSAGLLGAACSAFDLKV